MAVSRILGLLLLSPVLFTQVLDKRPPLRRHSKRDIMASMTSFISNVEKRLASVEASFDNSTEERLVARLEAMMEEKINAKQQEVEEKQQDVKEKLEDVEEKLQAMQDGMHRLESMVLDLLSSRLESMVTEILTSKMKASEQKVAEMEAKTNATEERLASLEVSKTEAQSSPASCRYQYLYQYEKEAPRTSGDLQCMVKLETELTRLQERVSALDKRLQYNDLSAGSLQNASVLTMKGIVHSVTELVAASEQSLKSTMENVTKFFSESAASAVNPTTFLVSMMNDTKAQLARVEKTGAVVNASITRVEQTTKELATRMSAMENKLDNATLLHAEEMVNTRVKYEDVQRQTDDRNNRATEPNGTQRYRRTCQDYYDHGQRSSGTYKLQLETTQSPMEVYCEMSNGTGWVVFQRRQNGSVNFYRDWTGYEDGFGDLSGEFWLGNRNIHRLTSAGLRQLRVDLQAWNGSTAFASYLHFRVDNSSSSYRLSVCDYSGTAGDSLGRHTGQKFTTFDRDQDATSDNCALSRKGGWWYEACGYSNLNGQYGSNNSPSWAHIYVHWYHWLVYQSLQRTELKLK